MDRDGFATEMFCDFRVGVISPQISRRLGSRKTGPSGSGKTQLARDFTRANGVQRVAILEGLQFLDNQAVISHGRLR